MILPYLFYNIRYTYYVHTYYVSLEINKLCKNLKSPPPLSLVSDPTSDISQATLETNRVSLITNRVSLFTNRVSLFTNRVILKLTPIKIHQ